jgi:hypothetical protein
MALPRLLLSIAGLALASALDVSLNSFKCDNSLPIYATVIGMYCGASKSCTFGEEATLYGTRKSTRFSAIGCPNLMISH